MDADDPRIPQHPHIPQDLMVKLISPAGYTARNICYHFDDRLRLPYALPLRDKTSKSLGHIKKFAQAFHTPDLVEISNASQNTNIGLVVHPSSAPLAPNQTPEYTLYKFLLRQQIAFCRFYESRVAAPQWPPVVEVATVSETESITLRHALDKAVRSRRPVFTRLSTDRLIVAQIHQEVHR